MTPLHAAAHNGSYHLAKMLIKSGADVNATTKVSKTVLMSMQCIDSTIVCVCKYKVTA